MSPAGCRIRAVGAVCVAGLGVEALWRGLCKDVSVVDDSARSLLTVAVPESVWVELARQHPVWRRLPRVTQLAALAVAESVRVRVPTLVGAPEVSPVTPSDDTGVVLGSCYANLGPIFAFCDNCAEVGPAAVSPMLFPDTVLNAPAGHIAILFGCRGPTATVTGLLSGSLAIVQAAEWIGLGHATRLIVCGAETLPPQILENALRADISSPDKTTWDIWSQADTGYALGEGAGALLLEPHDAKSEAWALLLAAAYVNGSAPGAVRTAIGAALDQAGCTTLEVGGLVLSVGGISDIDQTIVTSVNEVFGSRGHPIPWCSIKPTLGETFGGHGALALIAAGCAARAGRLPAAVGLRRTSPPDERTGHVSGRAQSLDAPMVLSVDADSSGACALLVAAET